MGVRRKPGVLPLEVTSDMSVKEWLVDIVRRKTSIQFTDSDWQQLAKHHADAIVARLLHSEPLPDHQHALYLRCVIAGIQQELRDCPLAGYDLLDTIKPLAYWQKLYDTMRVYQELDGIARRGDWTSVIARRTYEEAIQGVKRA